LPTESRKQEKTLHLSTTILQLSNMEEKVILAGSHAITFKGRSFQREAMAGLKIWLPFTKVVKA